MEIIDLYDFFSTLESIYLNDSLNSPISYWDFQKLLVPFTDVEVKEPVQHALKYFGDVKETPQTCKE